MFRAVADGFGYLYDLLGRLFTFLLEGIGKLLAPLFDFFKMIFYFIYFLGVIIAKVVLLVFTIGKLLIGLVTGLFATLIGFGYSGSSGGLPGSYQAVFTQLQPTLNALQLDKVAYLFQFAIWLFTGFMAMKIIGNMRAGGD